VVMLGIAMPSRGAGQSAAPVTASGGGDPWAQCRHEPDDRLRLSCYDREFDRREAGAARGRAAVDSSASLSAAAPAPAPARTPAPVQLSAATAPTPVAPAPVTVPPTSPATSSPPVATPKPHASAQHFALFHATITEMHFRGAGEFVITLDNGQVWTQYTVEGKPRIAVGDRVTIRPGWLGSYILSGPTEWITKVHPLEAG
jgi:hypothetical protein